MRHRSALTYNCGDTRSHAQTQPQNQITVKYFEFIERFSRHSKTLNDHDHLLTNTEQNILKI